MLSNIKLLYQCFTLTQQTEFVKMEKQITINLIPANVLVLSLNTKDDSILREADEGMA